MKDLTSSIESLGKKADGLIKAYRDHTERIAQLESDKDKLGLKVEGLNHELWRLREENKVLRMASAIKGDEDRVSESKRRISQLVREIDKCIALLND